MFKNLVENAEFHGRGCTSVHVKPISADNHVDHICIQTNPKVQVSDFVSVMQQGFQKHGISSQIVGEQVPKNCLYTSTYVARKSWDMAPYMVDAQIDILKDGRPIASANYHLKGRGGLALNKWASTQSKMMPVIDQLLAQLNPNRQVVTAPAAVPQPASQAMPEQASLNTEPSSELSRKLSNLKDA